MTTNNIVDMRHLLSQTKFYEGYSRWDDEKEKYESWNESVDRVISMHKEKYKHVMNDELSDLIEFARKAYSQKRFLGAQRALQFGGDQILKHQMKMYNCTSSHANRPEFFGEAFYILLCGAGVGFSVQKHHIKQLPKIAPRTKMAKIHVVEDSIEGWATALDILLSSYFVDGGKHPEFEGRRVFFDTSKIRDKNAYISGGFKAPGPDGLRLALDRIEHLLQKLVLSGISEISPIIAYDIVMHISDAVLSGGVRRSATICLFSHDDEEMVNAKTGNWFNDNPQRARSNNSAVIVRNEITAEEFSKVMKKVKQFGEPGFIFVSSKEHAFNPCVEIGMLPVYKFKYPGWQGCNLTEINGGLCHTLEDFLIACEAAAIIGTLQAGYTDFKFLPETTKKIFEREALIGCSITGWMNNPDILFNEKNLKQGAELIKKVNKRVAKLIGINPAARTTCVKPSGNASVLLQTASGIHAEHSAMYIRNVQLNKESEVSKLLYETNPNMVEESVWSSTKSDYVVSFPIKPKKGSYYKNDMLGVKLLEKVKLVQSSWIEHGTDENLCVDPTLRHNVSNTITVDDWDEVEKYVFKNRDHFAGISFMADAGDKAYNQAPNTLVLNEKQLIKKYGAAAIFASGLIVDGLESFDNLWDACTEAINENSNIVAHHSKENALKQDWLRRFKKFSHNYLNDDLLLTEHCLKDVYLLHKWNKIQNNYTPIDWDNALSKKDFVDIDTLGAIACQGGACEINF